MSELVSVIMPVYNSEHHVTEAIRSVLSQTYKNFELIIINDNSTDKSEEIIRSFNDTRIKLENLQTNVGVAQALNLGINISTGKYLLRMDADDICLKNRFASQVQFMTLNPNIAVSSGEAIILENDKITNKILKPPRKHRDCLSTLVSGNSCIVHPATIMRRDVIFENNFYDPNFHHAEDYELWTRLISIYTFGNLAKKLIYYRRHAKNISFLQNDTQKTSTLKANKILLLKILSPYFTSSELDKLFEYMCCFKSLNASNNLDLKFLDNIWKKLPKDLKIICYRFFKVIIRKNIMFLYWNPKDQISWALLRIFIRYRLKHQIFQ
ncbi:MAG: glycosyltransferase [Rhodobacteraceae bacterium]|nr:glycosyltransferase [Paracoccaceae bacterium]